MRELLDPGTLESFGLLRCRRCGLHRTDFRGSDEELSRYYGPAYYGVRGRRFHPLLERAIRAFRASRARLVRRAAGRAGRVLDLGCGRGHMIGALRREGWECAGTEFSAEMAESARDEHGVEVISGASEVLPFPDHSFDVVTAWHSLEHMRRPRRTLEEAARLLKPGGLLLVEVPNADSLQARLCGASWFHFDAPRHLYHFGRRDLRETLQAQGFTVLRESTTSLEQGPFGMVQSLLNRLTFAPNTLYGLLRRSGAPSRPRRWARAGWDLSVTVALVLPAGVVGTALELAACAAGVGGVSRILAVRTGASPARPAGGAG